MQTLRFFTRFARLIFHLLYALIFLAFYPNDEAKISKAQWRRIKTWNQQFLNICGVKLNVIGTVESQASLVISNHISWIDIAAISSIVNTGFVAKAEIAKWPVIGWLAKKTACLFIQRGHRGSTEKINIDISSHINSGVSILVFPEGTTTDGTSTKRFHSRLFSVAAHAKAPVLLLALRYPNSDHAAYIGDHQFFEHFKTVLKQPQTFVEITVIGTINKELDSKAYAKYCETQIREVINQA
jgi:1-acyl-sn-glycerol-3-phosphate acyltransferase